jgi:hypothetical protein
MMREIPRVYQITTPITTPVLRGTVCINKQYQMLVIYSPPPLFGAKAAKAATHSSWKHHGWGAVYKIQNQQPVQSQLNHWGLHFYEQARGTRGVRSNYAQLLRTAACPLPPREF